MDYASAIQWLYTQLPMYQRMGKAALNSNLDGISKLAKHLGNPHQKFKSVHIAGTNGKGSSAHMLASILQEAGYKVGLYTSPHLKDFSERIRINGVSIDQDYVLDFVISNRIYLEQEAFSFFEMTVAMAFDYFSKSKLNSETLKIAKKIASKSNLTIKIGKQAFYKQLEMPLSKAYAYTSKMMTLNMMAMDAKEGISAFLEKRKPKWKNK